MTYRNAVRMLFVLGALTGASLIGAGETHAQDVNKGQLVQGVAKLHAAQLQFVKKLADDASFAEQFDNAAGSGNYDAAAALVASATGLSRSAVKVSARRPTGDFEAAGGPASTRPRMYHLASLTYEPAPAITAATICFNLGIVSGCIIW